VGRQSKEERSETTQHMTGLHNEALWSSNVALDNKPMHVEICAVRVL
jgi:hypothetical protein